MVFTHRKYATPLRQVAEILTGVPIEVSETTEGKNQIINEMGITVGRFLQLLGTEMIREKTYPNVWIDALFRQIKPNENIVISDVRFPNEQNAVKQRDGIVILINSSRETSSEALAGRSTMHETERALDGVRPDYTVKNDGSIEELREKLNKLIAELFS